jgi:hypothetical protein
MAEVASSGRRMRPAICCNVRGDREATSNPQPGAGCVPANLDQQAKEAFVFRFGTAARDAVAAGTVHHTPNTDLQHFPDGLGTYSKGLLQASHGIPQAVQLSGGLRHRDQEN